MGICKSSATAVPFYAFIATQLTAVLFDVSGIKWPDLK